MNKKILPQTIEENKRIVEVLHPNDYSLYDVYGDHFSEMDDSDDDDDDYNNFSDDDDWDSDNSFDDLFDDDDFDFVDENYVFNFNDFYWKPKTIITFVKHHITLKLLSIWTLLQNQIPLW